jgi:hypothetical protein
MYALKNLNLYNNTKIFDKNLFLHFLINYLLDKFIH